MFILAYLTDGPVHHVLYNIITLLKPLKTRTGGQGQRTGQGSFRITTAIAHLFQVESLIKPEFFIFKSTLISCVGLTLLENTKQNFKKQNKIFWAFTTTRKWVWKRNSTPDCWSWLLSKTQSVSHSPHSVAKVVVLRYDCRIVRNYTRCISNVRISCFCNNLLYPEQTICLDL